MKDSDQRIRESLNTLGIAFEWFEHESMHRCEDTLEWHNEHKLPGVRAKNLFLRSKNGKRHFLLILPQEKSFNKDQFRAITEQKCGFADETRMMKYLGVKPGSVSPFCLVSDVDGEVELYIDEDLMKESYLYFHPQRNTASIQLTPAGVTTWLDSRQNNWQTCEWN